MALVILKFHCFTNCSFRILTIPRPGRFYTRVFHLASHQGPAQGIFFQMILVWSKIFCKETSNTHWRRCFI